MQTAMIQYKRHIEKLIDAQGNERPVIFYKKSLTRADCNLQPHEHTYYNSDLFVGMLMRAAKQVQQGREWQYLDSLPEDIKVDTSKFLAIVTITLPQSFLR